MPLPDDIFGGTIGFMPMSADLVTAVHASVDFNGADSLAVEVFDPATQSWVPIASKDIAGQHLGSGDVATLHTPGTFGWGAGSVQLRLVNRTTGQTIEMNSAQAQVTANADGSVTVRFEDTAVGDADFNDVVVTLENDTGTVSRRGLSSVQTPTPLPYTQEQLTEIQKKGAERFFELLSQAPAGSAAQTLYNLYRARAIGDLDAFKDKVDIAAVNADIRTQLQDPAVQALMAQAQSETAQAVLGVDSAQAAVAIRDTILSPETVAALQQLSPEARQQYIDNALTQLAFFDPAMAKETLKQLVAQMLTQGSPADFLANASPEAVERAVQAVFQISITEARFGFGALGNAATSLTKLTEAQLGEAQTAFAEWMRTGADPEQIDTVFGALLNGGQLTETSYLAVRNFAKNLSESGLLGSVGGVLAGIAVVQDFTGTGTMTTNTPWGIVNTTADVMSLVGAGENFAKAVTFLGLDRASQAAFRQLASLVTTANQAAPGALGQTLQGIELTDQAAVQAAIASNASLSAALGEEGVEDLAESVTTYYTAQTSATDATEFFDAVSTLDVEAEAAAGSVAGETLAGLVSEQGAQEIGTLPLTAENLAAFAEAQGAAAGLSEAEAAAAGSIAGDVAAAGAEVGSTSALAFSTVLKGLGVLGAVANFLYGAKSFAAAADSFSQGDTMGGALSLGSGVGFTVGGAAGVAAFIGSAAEVTALSGPAAPIVALGASLVGAGLAIWNYFHQKHRHDEQINELNTFLQSGVGTGRSYLLP